MNLNQLTYFLMVVDNGSVTQAAKKAFVSQAAVSKMIHQLENELGTELFIHEGRSLKLSREGKLFYSYVSDSLHLLNRGVQSLNQIDTDYYPVSILFKVASPLIVKIVMQIKQELPNVKLNITQHINGDTDLEQFDFIVSDEMQLHFKSEPIITEDILIGWNFSSGSKKYVTVDELQQTPCIAMSPGHSLRGILDTFNADFHLKIVPQYETDDPSTIRHLIENQIGWSFVPTKSWSGIKENFNLVQLQKSLPHRTIYLNTKHQQLSRPLQEVRNEIFNVFNS